MNWIHSKFIQFIQLILSKKCPVLRACGAEISEGRGSRVRIALSDVRAVFHRAHPRKETDRGAVVAMRRFLTEAGVEP